MNPIIKNKTWFFAFLLTLVTLIYGLFEVWIEHDELPENKRIELANDAINNALQNYKAFEYQFASESNRFANSIKQHIESSSNAETIFNESKMGFDFWGFSIFENEQLWLWSDFGDRIFPETSLDDTTGQFISVHQNNNVTFFRSRIPVFVENEDSLIRYDVFTRQKIQQKNILPIGDNSEINPSELFQSKNRYPIHFSFFEEPPQNPQFKTKLSTQNIDSVGIIYTRADDYLQYQSARQNRYFVYRAVFYALLIIFTTLFLITISKELSVWKSLFLKLFAITLAWLFFSNIDYGVGWIQLLDALVQQNFADLKPLINYCIHALFLLLIVVTSFKPLASVNIHLQEKTKPILTLTLGFWGILSALLLFFIISETYSLFLHSSIPVLDLEAFPGWITLLFYLSSGVLTISSLGLLALLGWFLVQNSPHSAVINMILMCAGFALALLLLYTANLYSGSFGWVLLATSIFFVTVLVLIVAVHQNPELLTYASRLRLLLLFSFISVFITYIALYKGYSEQLNNRMLEAAQSFVDEEASQAENIARDLLTSLEQSLSGLSEQDFIQRPGFTETFFTQQTQQLISEKWEIFSISTQLVNNSGEIVGEYSSDLDSPAWTRAFNMLSLLIPFEEERIRIENLRPIIRERPLNEANSNYSSFRRAWIPLYSLDEPQTRIGWILCSVYRERPQYEKPLRAVVALQSSKNWGASINITEYIGGRVARKNVVGIPLELPEYIRLDDDLIHEIMLDSILYRTQPYDNQEIRELFIATSGDQIIRAATNHPGYENHLFSVLRYFFWVLIAGFIVLGSLLWKKELNILGHNQRFRDRLIDRFIFASLLCLMILIAASYYAINNQNQKSVQDQLLNKLGNLVEGISLQESQSGTQSSISLSQISSTLDADASLYRDEWMELSTASQIYNQHLLPRLIPWDVHQSIYQKGNNQVTRKVILGNQELLIGYQPWLNEDGEIAGVVAIPTFLEAPKFNEQLLSTTSYLVGLYVIIFGLFIMGAALISTQLTAPLEALREGLKKISGGDLETTLPVKSKDEIGSLTNAYNVMVYRLKDLQKDLARAEREAAWKEMAQQVAHEIKNPLTPMKLNLQHLERQLNVPEEDFKKMKPQIEKIAKNMISQIETLSKIASDFSKFARPTQQEFEPVEINELIESVASLYEPEKKLSIQTKLHGGELWVSGVKDELRRGLINLVKNAHEAMPGGGKIILRSTLNAEKKQVSITIQDFGEGIRPESHNQIFVPNFSTKTSGTGLGLAITKKIVEEHGGHISFTSKVKKGTTFTIELPLTKEG